MTNPATRLAVEGNEAAARVAYQLSDVAAIYPITPSSPMGELCDQWAAQGRPNLWGAVPDVIEMQSEAGAAGTVHGAIQTGALASTFTASQGLLLMMPNMFKIAGELTPVVFHVAARSVATHALSIFGDHSDVMAVRSTGFGMLASGSVQEAHDLALVAHAATLDGRIPLVHFFDGFRISHEVHTLELLTQDDLKAVIREDSIRAHRERALNPDRPVLRGSAQNPDVFFQSREAANPYFERFPEVVQDAMDRVGARTGRPYHLFDYVGAPDAERVIVMMGSGAEAAHEVVEARPDGIGLLRVRLFRPFSARHLLEALPPTVRAIAVLDRTKEPGAAGEPLLQDVATAVAQARWSGQSPLRHDPRVVGGRYGLGSKEFTPADVAAVYRELEQEVPRTGFTLGIRDDVNGTSLEPVDPGPVEHPETFRAVFFGLGSDGTVGANKNSIKILADHTDLRAQGYFVYDSKKAGAVTVSHLRFGPAKIRSTYQIQPGTARFVACHQPQILLRQDVLRFAAEGATFLVNTALEEEAWWKALPSHVQRSIQDKKLRVYLIDAAKVSQEAGTGRRINTVMQTCFFALAELIPTDTAIQAIKKSIDKTYGHRGPTIVQANFQAVDQALAHLRELDPSRHALNGMPVLALVPEDAPDFVQDVTAPLMELRGDELPVSAMPVDGTFPTDTARFEKRGLTDVVPAWDEELCIQCARCVLVCPHACIRMKAFDADALEQAPAGFQSAPWRDKAQQGEAFTIQVAPDDCTGCELCVHVCPAKDKSNPSHKALDMEPVAPRLDAAREHWDWFVDLPDRDRTLVDKSTLQGSQLLRPLFEFSGACAGCGETPYLKLLTQLYGDRLLVANATGCSSIYGGNLPTTPFAKDGNGRGPAWSNSLFEDAAEFGMGFRVSLDSQERRAAQLLQELREPLGDELVAALTAPGSVDEADLVERRAQVERLRERLQGLDTPAARELLDLSDVLVPRSVWVVGGDGWAYDIGFGGLDHLFASHRNVNVLVLDTEVYSNTGGQASKATPLSAVAKFAMQGKSVKKKDLGMIAMSYQNVYVAQVAFGANDKQTVKAFVEAERHPGPSVILAYSTCIAHGFPIRDSLSHQKAAVMSGHWPLYRYRPEQAAEGKNPLQLDSGKPRLPYREFLQSEARFQMLVHRDPERARVLQEQAQRDVHEHYHRLHQLAGLATTAEENR